MKFRAPTDQPIHLALTSGHTAVVTREPVELHAMFAKEAISRGCLPGNLTEEEAVLIATGGQAQDPGFVRLDKLIEGINKMLDSSDEANFTNDGRPRVDAVSKTVGFTVTREEVATAWEKVSADLKKAGGAGADQD